MQDMNHDMDNLLRNAAEHYPLQQPADRWNEVSSKLAAISSAPEASKKTNRSRYLLILLLLLFITTAGIYYFNTPGTVQPGLPGESTTNNKSIKTTTTSPSPGPSVSLSTTTISAPAVTQLTTSNNQPSNSMNTGAGFARPKPSADPVGYIPATNAPLHQSYYRFSLQKSINREHTLFSVLNDQVYINDILSTSITGINHPVEPMKDKNPATRPGFYVGLSGSPAFSKVKDGGFNKMGFEVGILAGYRINHALSVETGLFFAQRHYWVKKEYFNTKQFNAAMPTGMQLMEVHGGNCVFNLPLHLRYHLPGKNKAGFFASAGIVSSLLVKEHNDYTTMLNGGVENIKVEYSANQTYLASTIELSAGIEPGINNRLNIRIQPYYQLPLNGMGVGLVPVTTAGLRLGLILPSGRRN